MELSIRDEPSKLQVRVVQKTISALDLSPRNSTLRAGRSPIVRRSSATWKRASPASSPAPKISMTSSYNSTAPPPASPSSPRGNKPASSSIPAPAPALRPQPAVGRHRLIREARGVEDDLAALRLLQQQRAKSPNVGWKWAAEDSGPPDEERDDDGRAVVLNRPDSRTFAIKLGNEVGRSFGSAAAGRRFHSRTPKT